MFKLTKPCDNCPFLVKGGIRLHPERAREIAHTAIDPQGSMFPCHRTTTFDDDGEVIPTNKEQFCAGALNFALNVGRMNQMMRIGTRTGWDPKKMTDRNKVFKSLSAMVKANPGRKRG